MEYFLVDLSMHYMYTYLKMNIFFSILVDHVEDPKGGFTSGSMSGWKVFIIIIIAIIGLAVCGVVGYVVFNKDVGYNSKRFY